MSIATVLAWIFDNAPGIRTVDGVLTEWPMTLGPIPSEVQIDAWNLEYEKVVSDVTKSKEAESLKKEQATTDLKVIIAEQSKDENKLALKDIVERIKKIEAFLGI